MIVQIYSVTHPEDVRSLVELGVDHIGLTPAGQGVPSGLQPAEARAIFDMLPPTVLGIALTILTDIQLIAEMARELEPAILHLCPRTEAISPEQQRELRSLLPDGMRIMKAIAVGGADTAERAIDAAERFAPMSDFLLLDTDSPDMEAVGAAGRTHDWSVSAEIVERVGASVPVILAGGLGPENVAEAIRRVRPAGVDSLTLTNRADNRRRKEPHLVQRFTMEARRAAAELGL